MFIKCISYLKKASLSLVLIGGLLLTSCQTASKPKTQNYSAQFFTYFDTVSEIKVYGMDLDNFNEVKKLIEEDLKTYHELYDIYHSYDGMVNIYDLNNKAGQGPQEVDEKIIDMLTFSKQVYELSHGKVNIAMGSVLKIWHDHREEAKENPDKASLPNSDELKEANRHTDIKNLLIDKERKTVELTDPAMRLDVGAIAKGYATERIAQKLEELGYSGILLNIGGNIRTVGYKNVEEGLWTIGIDNPVEETGKSDAYTDRVRVGPGAVVTSGLYQRYFIYEGKKYHHIIDPDSLFPEYRYLMVSIVCPSSALADGLSTALFNMDLEEGQKLIDSLEDTEALWLKMDGSIVKSKGFEALEP